jgi:hypothetical protein
MTRKAPSYLRQLAQPVPAGGAVLSVPRRVRGRVSEKFGLAGVPVIQDAEETIAAPLTSRHVPLAASALRRESSKPAAEVETAGPAARHIVTSHIEATRPAAAVEKNAEVRLESKPRAKTVAAPREESAAATQDMRGERERSVSAEAVPQRKPTTAQTMEAAVVSQRAEKSEAERKDEAVAVAVEMRREVLRVERERVIESDVRPLEAKPQRASQPASQSEPKPAEQRASIHIGTVEVRIVTPAPPAPAPMPQSTIESQPARLGPPTPAPSLARSLAWNYGLVQG